MFLSEAINEILIDCCDLHLLPRDAWASCRSQLWRPSGHQLRKHAAIPRNYQISYALGQKPVQMSLHRAHRDTRDLNAIAGKVASPPQDKKSAWGAEIGNIMS